MRTSIAAITFICLCLSSAAFGQSAILKGKVVDDKGNPVSNVRILTPDGQADTTDSKGQFTIAFPTTVQPGQATRIELRDKPGWVIYEPLLGNCVTQSAARNFEPLKIIIVPKGSLLALSPERISQVIRRWAVERAKLRAQVAETNRQLDEYAFLRDYAKEYGFTLEQFRNAAKQWAKIKASDDKYERAIKAYWQEDYDSAARLALESGDEKAEELKRIKNEQIVVGRNTIRRYQLAGNSFYQQYEFREAMAAYGKIEELFSEKTIAKEDFLEEWAETKNLLGIVKAELGNGVEGQESESLLGEAVAAFREALQVYTSERSPQDWAVTQSNLGNALMRRGERSDGAEGVRLLGEAVTAFQVALKFRIREHSTHGWGMTQNNLGMALRLLGERSGGGEGVRLLGEAVVAFREALQVYTREDSPRQWATTQDVLGKAYFLLKNWKDAALGLQRRDRRRGRGGSAGGLSRA